MLLDPFQSSLEFFKVDEAVSITIPLFENVRGRLAVVTPEVDTGRAGGARSFGGPRRVGTCSAVSSAIFSADGPPFAPPNARRESPTLHTSKFVGFVGADLRTRKLHQRGVSEYGRAFAVQARHLVCKWEKRVGNYASHRTQCVTTNYKDNSGRVCGRKRMHQPRFLDLLQHRILSSILVRRLSCTYDTYSHGHASTNTRVVSADLIGPGAVNAEATARPASSTAARCIAQVSLCASRRKDRRTLKRGRCQLIRSYAPKRVRTYRHQAPTNDMVTRWKHILGEIWDQRRPECI